MKHELDVQALESFLIASSTPRTNTGA
jgi:hypothetical protein